MYGEGSKCLCSTQVEEAPLRPRNRMDEGSCPLPQMEIERKRDSGEKFALGREKEGQRGEETRGEWKVDGGQDLEFIQTWVMIEVTGLDSISKYLSRVKNEMTLSERRVIKRE